jgi:hypothetical protein
VSQSRVRPYGCEKVHAAGERYEQGDQPYANKPHEVTLAISPLAASNLARHHHKTGVQDLSGHGI